MAALPDDMRNLEPSSTREWLQLINRKVDSLADSQQEDRELLEKFVTRSNERLESLEKVDAATAVEIDSLKGRVNSWSLINSLAAAIAVVLGALGLKGS